MKKILFVTLMMIFGFTNSAGAETIEIITKKKLEMSEYIYLLCIDGYEYVITSGVKELSTVQSNVIYPDGKVRPKMCQKPSEIDRIVERIHGNKGK